MPDRPSSGHPGQPSRPAERRCPRVLFGSRAPVSSTSRSRSPRRPFVMQSVDSGIREAIEEYIRNFNAALPLAMHAGALAAPAWEPLSDEDRADQAAMALRRRHEAVTWRIAGQVHLLPPRTQGEVVDLMLKLGLIQRVGDGSSVRWRIVRPLPRPEVVILPDNERGPRRDE